MKKLMKAVIAIDSMKGSLSSLEAGHAAAEGIKKVYNDAEVIVSPLADGGEGTVRTLISGIGGTLNVISVTGPLGEKVLCEYGIIQKTKTAVIEMAGASGITLIPKELRNPFNTTTYGVGEVILDAIRKGCRRFIIGIGGSATNDGGIGMLQALGYQFFDQYGIDIPAGAKGLKVLDHFKCENVVPELKQCEFFIACDVKNPLYGPNGCSVIYGPQKGADQSQILQMDQWMKNYAKITKQIFNNADPFYPGSGAAGGIGFAFHEFMNADLRSGVEIVLEELKLEKEIKDADIVITGEGCLDGQTAMGKAPIGVAALAKKYNVPVIAVAGSVKKDASMCNEKGVDAFFPILRQITSLEKAMDHENAKSNLTDTIEQIFRLWKVCC